MNKPRVLIFIDWFAPGYKAGGPIQSCVNLVEHLQKDFDFWVITRDADYCETEPYTTVKSDTWNQLAPYLKVYYISADNLKFSTVRKVAFEVKPDVILINGIYSYYFSILPLYIARSIHLAGVVVSARGMLIPSAINVKSSKKKFFLGIAKFLDLYKDVRFHATSEGELDNIRNVIGTENEIFVAPNLAKPINNDTLKARKKNLGELRLISVARISPEKNTLFALEVLSEMKSNFTVSLDLYGPIYDESYWKTCCYLIETMPHNIKVNYKGSISNKLVHDTLQEYHALFLPTRGENFGHIILESLAAGLPVLISDQTPWRYLAEKNVGYDLPLDLPHKFQEAIDELASFSQDQYSKISEAALNYAQAIIQNQTAVEQTKNLFKF